MPVREVRGHGHFREGVAEGLDVPPRDALLDAGEEAVVNVLLDPGQAPVLIEIVEGDEGALSEKVQRPAEGDQGLVEEDRPRLGEQAAEPRGPDAGEDPPGRGDRVQRSAEIKRAVVQGVIEEHEEPGGEPL